MIKAPYHSMNHLMVTACLLLPCFLFSCKSNSNNVRNNEGVIVYDVSFPYDKDNPYINIYPKEMTFFFKNGKVRAKLASFAEVVCSELIVDHQDKTFTHCFKVFDERFRMDLDSDGVQEMIAEFPNAWVEDTSERDSLAGFLCQRSVATFANELSRQIDLYHTASIDIPDPNWCNPFRDVPQVLLSYELEQFGKRMRLTAREVRYEDVSDDLFLIPQDYQAISFPEMKGKVGELVAQFDQ